MKFGVKMTLLDVNRFASSNGNLWDENTLKPPLKLKDLIKDLYFHWNKYKVSKINFYRRLAFLLLMIHQRIAYNLGWLLAIHKSQKECYLFPD